MPESSAMLSPVRKVADKGERPAVSLALRDFEGVNLTDNREGMPDNQFYWLEDMIPLGRGRLALSRALGAAIATPAGEVSNPVMTVPFTVAGVNYAFAMFPSGNGWVGQIAPAATWTKILTGLTQTAAAPYGDLGVLIVDATQGYYDWGVTTPATLTPLSGGITDPVIVPPALCNGPADSQEGTLAVNDTGPGAGATVGMSVTCISAGPTHAAGGTGYSLGDLLTPTTGAVQTNTHAPIEHQNQPLQLRVSAVDTTSGAILEVTIENPGYYIISPSKVGSPFSCTGGTGTGATFQAAWQFTDPFIITPGHGYVAPFITRSTGGPFTAFPTFQVSTAGTLNGTSIAVYAGRVWIGIERTVQFTDIDSYNFFGGVGGAFTIDDDYFHGNITCLLTANNYLYITSAASFDILSNVQVSNDVTTFSRVNATAAIGTDKPMTVFAFGRSIMFANQAGFWELSGATPMPVSKDIEQLIENLGTNPPSAGQLDVYGVRSIAFLVEVNDIFTGAGARQLLCVRTKNRWWFTGQGGNVGLVFSVIEGTSAALYGWVGPTLYGLIYPTAAFMLSWRISTKLYDLGAPMTEKDVLNIAATFKLNGAFASGISATLDNPKGTTGAVNFGAQQPSASGYSVFLGQSPPVGWPNVGLTITGTNNTQEVRLIAMHLQPGVEWSPRAN